MLVDIVSKNGNLLLNIPVRGDGTIDEDEVAFLQEMAAWMDVNGEAIFGTRPWEVYGEGPSTTAQAERDRPLQREAGTRYTAEDIRFTTKGDALYAIGLGWPEDGGKVTIKSLASDSPQVKGRSHRSPARPGRPAGCDEGCERADRHATRAEAKSQGTVCPQERRA